MKQKKQRGDQKIRKILFFNCLQRKKIIHFLEESVDSPSSESPLEESLEFLDSLVSVCEESSLVGFSCSTCFFSPFNERGSFNLKPVGREGEG